MGMSALKLSPNISVDTDAQSIPQGYKRTEIGVIPEDWEVEKISKNAVIKTGGRNTQDRIEDGEYPFFVRSQTVERINSYSYDGESVLTAGDGVGTGKVFHYINGRFDVHQRVYRISDFSNELNGKYLFYQFSTRFYDRIMSMTAKSSVDSVRMEMIAGMQIPIPKPVEQQAITEALSDVDALIESLEKLIAKKRDIKQATMQQLLTGKTRLPGFERKKGYQRTEIGVIPEDWKVQTLGKTGECFIGLTYSPSNVQSDGSLVLRSSNIGDGILKFDDNVYVDVQIPEKLIVQENDILICVRNGSRPLIGKCALIDNRAEGMTFGAFMSVYRSPYNHFIFYCFQSYLIKKQIHEHLGATINQITNKSLRSFSIPFPEPAEQTAIAAVLSDMDIELATLEQRLEKTKQIKQGMMQQLLTGKVRLVSPQKTETPV